MKKSVLALAAILFIYAPSAFIFAQPNNNAPAQLSPEEQQLIVARKANEEAQAEYYRQQTLKLNEKPGIKITEVVAAFLPFIGVIVGGGLTLLGTRYTKRQEWRSEVNKQLIERRIAAYEELINVVYEASIGVGELIKGVFLKYPFVLSSAERYDQWSLQFKITGRKVSHYIDKSLSNKLTNFQNYLVYLDEILNEVRNGGEEFRDQQKVNDLGVILYDDFRKLTSEILEEAGMFFSTNIYNESFVPSLVGDDKYELPKDFAGLALFARRREIEKLLKGT